MVMNLSGATTAVFVVSLSSALSKAVSVGWKTADGTAKAGTDYIAASGVVTFDPGETAKQVQVVVYGRAEGDTSEERTFQILLTPPENAILDQELTEVTIQVSDEEGLPITSLVVATGPRGLRGLPGMSSYELAKLQGFVGTLAQYIERETAAGSAADRAEAAAGAAADEATAEIDAQLEQQKADFQQFLATSGYAFLGDYESGPLQINARNQYIRYGGQYWKLNAATNVGYITTGITAATWEADKTHFVLIDGDTLRQELTSAAGGDAIVTAGQGGKVSDVTTGYESVAVLRQASPNKHGQRLYLQGYVADGDVGSGHFRYDASDTTTPDDGWAVIVTGAGKRLKRIMPRGKLSMAYFGIKAGDDVTEPFKKAVAYLKAAFIAANAPSDYSFIEFESGKYRFSATVEMPSFIKVLVFGSAEFDASSIPTGRIFDVHNDQSIPRPGFSGPGDRHPTFKCIGGTLTITGSGKKSDGVDAFTFGNKADNLAPCRGIGLENVTVRYCRSPVSFRSKRVYLSSFDNFRFEQNYYNLASQDATSADSGEAITFTRGTFAAADGAHFLLNAPATEWIFDNCQGDFSSGHVLEIGAQCDYSSLKFTNFRCEEFRGDFVKATPSQRGNVSVFFTNLSILPRSSGNELVGNSPSRQMFNVGPGCFVDIRGLEIMTEMRPYTDNIMLSAEAGGGVAVSGYIKSPYRAIPSSDYILNRGCYFGDETTGTSISTPATSLTRFVVDTISGITGTVVDLDGKKALQLNGASTASYLRMYSKEYIPVQPGNMIAGCAAIQALQSSGSRNMGFTVSWYDKDLNLISTPGQSVYNFNDAFSDSKVPNFAQGTIRKMSSSAFSRTAPAGAAYARPRWEFSALSGIMNVINMIVFKVL